MITYLGLGSGVFCNYFYIFSANSVEKICITMYINFICLLINLYEKNIYIYFNTVINNSVFIVLLTLLKKIF